MHHFKLLAAIWFLCLTGKAATAPEILGPCRTNDNAFNTEEGGCLDFKSGLVWSLGTVKETSYKLAQDYCNELDESDYNDWELPKRDQLEAVAEDRRADTYFEFQLTSPFWASSKGSSRDTWTINLRDSSRLQKDKKDETAAAVCVRQPKDIDLDRIPNSSDKCNATPKNLPVWTVGEHKGCGKGETQIDATKAEVIVRKASRLRCKQESEYFASNGQGCSDLKTRLTWRQETADLLDRPSAERHCQRIVDKGQGGWRLPSASELVGVSGPSLAGAHFNLNTNAKFWSSTEFVKDITPLSKVSAATGYSKVLVQLSDGAKFNYPYRQTYELYSNPVHNKDKILHPEYAFNIVCVR